MPESRREKYRFLTQSGIYFRIQGFIGIAIIPSGTHPSRKKRSHFLAYCKGVYYHLNYVQDENNLNITDACMLTEALQI